MAIRRVDVAGCGLTGSDSVQACAAAGCPTVVRDADAALLERRRQAGAVRGRRPLRRPRLQLRHQLVLAAGRRPGRIQRPPRALLVPCLLEAVRLLEAGTAARDDIDSAMKPACGHPVGPLALADFRGLDDVSRLAGATFAEPGAPHLAPPPLLRQLVEAGHTGGKAGRGLYDYTRMET